VAEQAGKKPVSSWEDAARLINAERDLRMRADKQEKDERREADNELREADQKLGERAAALESEVQRQGRELEGAKRGFVAMNETVRRLSERAEREDAPPPPVFCWLTCSDPVVATDKLEMLESWLNAVYVRYPRGAQGKENVLPDCWRRHDWVVEELFVLMDLWLVAYAPGAQPSARGDWHLRHRPEAVRRVGEIADCSLSSHVHRAPADYINPTLLGIDDRASIVSWWTQTHGTSPDPTPTQAALAEARARRAEDMARLDRQEEHER